MYYKKEIDYRTQAHTLTWISLPSFIPTTQILSLPHSFIPATQILSLSLCEQLDSGTKLKSW